MGGGVAVVADSACDLPPDVTRSAGVTVVPLTVTFGDRSFLDGVELDAAGFWDRVAQAGPHPTTASPSPQALLDAWGRADGGDGVVSVHLAGGLSRTVETARLAAQDAGTAVEVVDSGAVSMGEGLVVMAAAAEARRGGDRAGVAEAARGAAARLATGTVLESVDFLRRGGRVGAAKALASDLLRIRPVLSMEEGAPVLVGRARTRHRALDEVLRRLPADAESAAVFHASAIDLDEAVTRVEEVTGVAPVVGLIGPVTGSHLGPGALGVAAVGPSVD